VILYAIVKWTGFGSFLFERPDWAHIDGPKAGQRSNKSVNRPAREAA
jgi:hypothetical protein